jgi:prepilin-type N-terminal cleavage/methylation domain-containing protein
MKNGVKTKLSGWRRAFTLLELLVMIAIIAILAALIFPVLSRAKMKAQRVACLNNLRQLSYGCKMYADDSSGQLVSSWPLGDGTTPVNPYSWCPGWASTQPEDPTYGPLPDFACTNEYALEQGKIWSYVKAASVYRCPSDKRSVDSMPVVRSYSMNAWMNGRSYGDPSGSSDFTTPDQDDSLTYVLFRRENQLPDPSQLWTLTHEDADTINDSMFMVDMGSANHIADRPANLHGGVFVLGFADGHMASVNWQESSADWEDPDGDADWVKLKSLTTVKR